MSERTLSQSTTSLVRSKSLRLPSKNKDVIQENIRNVSSLSRSGSLRDHKKNKDLVGVCRDDSLLHGSTVISGEGIARSDKDSIRALSKSCHGSLGSSNGASHDNSLRRNGSSGGSLSSRRPFNSRAEHSRAIARASPVSPTGSTPPPRERGGPELRETREMRTNNGRDYAADLKLLVAEHLKLQQEYARVRQQLVEKNVASTVERIERGDRSNGPMSPTAGQRSPCAPSSLSELSSIPELDPQPPQQLNDINNNSSHINGNGKTRDTLLSVRCCSKRTREDVAVEAYRREVLRLQEELHRMQKLYWNQVILQQTNSRHPQERDGSGIIVVDLLNQLEANRGELLENRSKVRRLEEQLNASVRETALCRDALRDYQLQLDEQSNCERSLKRRLAEAMDELREAREALQFAEDELRSMAATDPVPTDAPIATAQQQPEEQQQSPTREKSLKQNSERTPPDGKSHQSGSVNGGAAEALFYDTSEKENKDNATNQSKGKDSCGDQWRSLQAHQVIVELSRQLEAMVREDGRFAEDHLDLSDLELKRVVEPDSVLHYPSLPSNVDKSTAPIKQTEEAAQNAALGWARRGLAGRRVLRARLLDKMKTAQDQIVELKNSLDLMCRRHSDCEELVRSLELKLEQGGSEIAGLRSQLLREQDEHRNEIQSLKKQIDELSSKNRSSCCRSDTVDEQQQSVAEHYRIRHDETTSQLCRNGPTPSDIDGPVTISTAALQRDNILLKQEISKLREAAHDQEELVRAMAAEFRRSQQLWEDNYCRTRADLRARDQQVDSVVDVLRGLPEVVGQCPSLHLLYRSLTDPGARPPANKLGVKSNGVVASAV
ncbi:hypothetical protein BIW11_02556 [Tropilaelaps mercedesae]|uniref:Uncharacterized protein n=1 Tax=Tropilaelaps mercedesae TaxID=418985 RepID=A0A1V9Y1E5_9ACAR|nr:hypothetical protein BIW11_02556 [Tropilaelaps mercedesae]